MPIDLSQLTSTRAVLEIRYEPAILLWDRTGSIFAEIRKLYPAIEFKNTQPNQQIVRLKPNLELSFNLDRAVIVSGKESSDCSELKKAGGDVFPIVLRNLEIVDLKRIGLRVVMQKEFPTKIDAGKYILERMPTLNRKGKYFGLEANVTDPEISLRWEGETIGCMVRLSVIGHTLKVEIPIEFPDLDPIDLERHSATLDVDFYAHGITAASKFNAPAIVETWLQLIRRDVGGFLNG